MQVFIPQLARERLTYKTAAMPIVYAMYVPLCVGSSKEPPVPYFVYCTAADRECIITYNALVAVWFCRLQQVHYKV